MLLGHTREVELVPVTADDVDMVDVCAAVLQAAQEADGPPGKPYTRRSVAAEVEHGWDGEPPRTFVASAGGVPVGFLAIYASSYDNLDLAYLDLCVHPDHRRAGHGSRLLEEAVALCQADGRPLVLLEGWESAALHGFAASVGFPVKQVMAVRDQPVGPECAARFAALRAEAEAHSAAYDLVRVEGRTPDHLLEGLVAATGAINDAPNDDLEYADEVFSADRVRAYEDAQLASGHRFRRVIAVHRETGEVAGHTVVVVDGELPRYAEQHDTTVLPGHRGHRLGLRLKADMVCWLNQVEPELRLIRTENAESNGPMVAVNERLGYRVAGRRLILQRRLPGSGTLLG